jgi:hypothetical protein
MLALLALTMIAALFVVVFNLSTVLLATRRAFRYVSIRLFAQRAGRDKSVKRRKLRRERPLRKIVKPAYY